MAAAITRHSRAGLRARVVAAIAGFGVLALLALTMLLVGTELTGAPSNVPDVHTSSSSSNSSTSSASAEHEHSVPLVHSVRQQPSTRARGAALGVLVATVLVATSLTGRIGSVRQLAPRILDLGGRPPGRAPPRLRLA
jgi:hypothetical protein